MTPLSAMRSGLAIAMPSILTPPSVGLTSSVVPPCVASAGLPTSSVSGNRAFDDVSLAHRREAARGNRQTRTELRMAVRADQEFLYGNLACFMMPRSVPVGR